MTRRAVYVHGVGAVTPLGLTWPETARRLADGACAVRPIDAFDTTGYPSTVAASVPLVTPGPDRRRALGLKAAHEAWAAADVRPDPDRLGVFIGAESGRATIETIICLVRIAVGPQTFEVPAEGRPKFPKVGFDHAAFGLGTRALAEQVERATVSPATVAAAIASTFDARGPVATISIACASGAAAIIEGTRAIRLGRCDVAICGGVGADVDPLMLVGFGKLRALSARGVSRPFDVHRDGFVVGEGAAMLVLSADPGFVEIAGIARSLDGHHLTAPHPDGDGARRAMQGALADAGDPVVDYVQAHGTSTPLNDRVEAQAIAAVVGDAVPVASVKGAMGHWIAGAGAIGCLTALHALTAGELLPTANLTTPDPECPVRHVQQTERQAARAALVNAFAFGGANASLVLRAS